MKDNLKYARPFLIVLAVATVFLLAYFIIMLFTGDKEPQPARDITGVTADGKSLYSLSDNYGTPTVLIFFDLETRHSQELMQQLIPAAAEKKVDVIAVCIGDGTVEESLQKMEELEIPQAPHTLFDLDGEMAKEYNVTAGPVTYFIDKNGMLQDAFLAAISEKTLEKELAAIA